MLAYLHNNPTPENINAVFLLCFPVVFRMRTGYETLIRIKENDLCLGLDNCLHYQPLSGKTERAKAVSKRSRALMRGLGENGSISNEAKSNISRINNHSRRRPANLKTSFSLMLRAYELYRDLKVASGRFDSARDFRTTTGRAKPEFMAPFMTRGPASQMHMPIDTRGLRLTTKWSARRHSKWFHELQTRAGCSVIVKRKKALRGFFSQMCVQTQHDNFGWQRSGSRLAIYNEVGAHTRSYALVRTHTRTHTTAGIRCR